MKGFLPLYVYENFYTLAFLKEAWNSDHTSLYSLMMWKIVWFSVNESPIFFGIAETGATSKAAPWAGWHRYCFQTPSWSSSIGVLSLPNDTERDKSLGIFVFNFSFIFGLGWWVWEGQRQLHNVNATLGMTLGSSFYFPTYPNTSTPASASNSSPKQESFHLLCF